MPTDPVEEWRRLTSLYSEMGDVEIRELADQIRDLTPEAQQILRDELKKRGVVNPSSTSVPASQGTRAAAVNWEPANYRYQFSPLTDETDGPREYTWKTPLCTCDTNREALAIGLALKRAGIDSWIEAPESRSGLDGSRVLVAADQLEEAKSVIVQPVPQDIIDEVDDRASDNSPYELPVCPECKAPDPTLESVEPSNNWLCESCGYTWSDPVADPKTAANP